MLSVTKSKMVGSMKIPKCVAIYYVNMCIRDHLSLAQSLAHHKEDM